MGKAMGRKRPEGRWWWASGTGVMERHRKRRCRGESGREASTERGREREEEGVEREKEQGEEREIGRT